MIEFIRTLDSVVTKEYVNRCADLAERLASNAEPQVSGEDLIAAIQEEVPIPTTISDLPPTGLLGLCVNLVTIVHHEEEDPIENVLRTLSEGGIQLICYPGTHHRESQREHDRFSDSRGLSTHRF
jgi:hypothetical protein